MRNLNFFFLKRSTTSAINFLIQLKCNAIAERNFRTKLKRNLTSAIEILQHNANTAFFKFQTKNEYIICERRPTFINITIEMDQN